MSSRSLAVALLAFAAMPAHGAVTFAGNLVVAGEVQDLSGLTGTGNARLSFGSDLFYDRATNLYYGITDRGPGGGVYDFAPRVSIFQLAINATTGTATGFTQVSTVVFRGPDGSPLTGLAPNLIPGGNSATLGRSFDSEGFAKLPNGNFLVSDEYGPSIYEFKSDGSFVRAFTQPANILPRANGTPDYSGTALTAGRQDNRGYEGLTVSPDGKTAYAILQDPLVNEGSQNSGTRSPNLRIVQFDVATGQSTAQYIYQLDSVASINATLPAGANTFGATAQGRNIGVSSITALGNGRFLVIERDNRGFGVGDATATGAAVGSKRVYLIDLSGATDASGVSLANTNTLPAGVIPVTKSLFLDIQRALQLAGLPVPEKLEGLTLGPLLANGGITLVLATDNDFSVTQDGSLTQFDVCTSGTGAGQVTTQVTFGAPCPTGQRLIPTNVYTFAVTGIDALALGVPEPSTWMMMIGGFGLVGAALRRRAKLATA